MEKSSKESYCQSEQEDYEESTLQYKSKPETEIGSADVEDKAQAESDTQVIKEGIFPNSETQQESEDPQSLNQDRYNVSFPVVASADVECQEAEEKEKPAIVSPLQLNRLQVDNLSPVLDVRVETNVPDEFPKACSSSSTFMSHPMASTLDRDMKLLENEKLKIDPVSDIETSSSSTENASSHSISQPIAIPSTSREMASLEPERSSPKRPTNFGPYVKQSIHVFHPRDPNSVLKKLPVPYVKGRVYLRDSPESSDYGGSPDSLEDPFLMEALYSAENKYYDTPENLNFELSPRTCMNAEENNQPSTSNPIQENVEDLSPCVSENKDFTDLSSGPGFVDESFKDISAISIPSEGSVGSLSTVSGFIESNRKTESDSTEGNCTTEAVSLEANRTTQLDFIEGNLSELPAALGQTEEIAINLYPTLNVHNETFSDLLLDSDLIEGNLPVQPPGPNDVGENLEDGYE